FATPILLLFAGIRLSPAFRARVTSISPILLIAMNGWRFVGLGFLMAYVEGLLPGGFARQYLCGPGGQRRPVKGERSSAAKPRTLDGPHRAPVTMARPETFTCEVHTSTLPPTPHPHLTHLVPPHHP